MGVGAAGEGFQEHENDTPEDYCDDEDVVEDAEGLAVVEDSAVEEKHAEFYAAVGEFFDN